MLLQVPSHSLILQSGSTEVAQIHGIIKNINNLSMTNG